MKKGFTVVEMLVSLAILSFIFGMGFAGYVKFSQKQTLVSSGQTLRNLLRDAQSRAYTGETDCTVCDCTTGNSQGWSVDFSTQQIYGRCEDGTAYYQKPFALSPHITIVAYVTPPGGSVAFQRFPPGATEATMCLAHDELSSSYYRISVTAGGDISSVETLQSSCP